VAAKKEATEDAATKEPAAAAEGAAAEAAEKAAAEAAEKAATEATERAATEASEKAAAEKAEKARRKAQKDKAASERKIAKEAAAERVAAEKAAAAKAEDAKAAANAAVVATSVQRHALVNRWLRVIQPNDPDEVEEIHATYPPLFHFIRSMREVFSTDKNTSLQALIDSTEPDILASLDNDKSNL
jgi:hypothetical protein